MPSLAHVLRMSGDDRAAAALTASARPHVGPIKPLFQRIGIGAFVRTYLHSNHVRAFARNYVAVTDFQRSREWGAGIFCYVGKVIDRAIVSIVDHDTGDRYRPVPSVGYC